MAVMVDQGESKDFAPAPEGTHQAVCVDVIDLGLKETPWGPKRKIEIRWQIGEAMENGKPFLINKRYTASLYEKAVLSHDLQAWRGKAFTEGELAGFDVEAVVGANCLVSIVHKKDAKGRTWANVVSLAPLIKGMPKIAAKDYIRERDRQPQDMHDDVREDEESVPF